MTDCAPPPLRQPPSGWRGWLARRVTVAITAAVAAISIAGFTLAADLVILYPPTGWSGLSASFNGGPIACHNYWSYDAYVNSYDDTANRRVYIDQWVGFNGVSGNGAASWVYMYIVALVNTSNTQFYSTGFFQKPFANSWNVDPLHWFSYERPNKQVYFQVTFGIFAVGGCDHTTYLVLNE